MSVPPRLFDRALLRTRRLRAGAGAASNFLLDRAAEDLADRLQTVNRRFTRALDLGTPGDALVRSIKETDRVGEFVACEPFPQWRDPAAALRVAGDDEALPFANETFDLVVSAMSLHWSNDLPGTLVQIRRALKPDGLVLASLIGGETLHELRECLALAEAEITGGASPRVAPFVEVSSLGSLLQRAGFALPVTDVDRLTVRYANLTGLFNDLRAMGAVNALAERSRTPLRRSMLARAAEIYAERFADPDGRLRATFDLIWISAWAPHAGQQQPLKPGSATSRLADALGTVEQKAGEKARPRRED
jgi:SAM-dependent methyltransferase